MARMIFVNLPVDDLEKSVAFFSSLGFGFNAAFTDDKATCMVLSEHACVMLLVRPFFATFTTKPLAEEGSTEAILAVSAQSRDEVDALVDRALSLGGTPAMPASDEGFMYGRSFYDLDGHAWEVMWMDAVAVG